MLLTTTLNAAIDKRYVISNFEEGSINRVIKCSYTPGGKGLNVAKIAALAGGNVLVTGFAGGYAGHYIVDSLKLLGIESDFYRLDVESRSCMNIWDLKKNFQTEILEPGFEVTEDEFEEFLKHFVDLLHRADVVTLSGSIPKGLKATTYQTLIEIVKNTDKKVILDTSGDLLRMGMRAKPTMIKPNIDEIRMLTGKKCLTIEAIATEAQRIHDTGIEVVVISLGAEGSIMVTGSGTYRARIPKIDTVNTVGCGDAMVAGFALGLEKGFSMTQTFQNASALSVASALQEETGFFAKEDMDKILLKVEIVKIQ